MQKLRTFYRIQLGMLRSIAAYYWKPFNLRRLSRFYSQFIKEGDLCFDVGAHLGNRSHAWSHVGAKVIAVEPQPRCIAYMERKFRRDPNITIVPKGLGAEPGILPMAISHVTPTVSTFASKEWQQVIDDNTSFNVQWEETLDVEVITLDQLIEEYGMPVFCKIDVEGYELEVLKGLSQAIPALSAEFFHENLDYAIQCVKQINALGDYEYNWSYAESQVMASKDWVSAEDLISFFRNYDVEEKFGDFYARLKV